MELVDDHGNYIGGIPADAIRDCSASGSVDEAVRYWVDKLEATFPRELMERWLKEFGAWDDLKSADDGELVQRCFWLACCELKENGEWFGLVS